MPKTGIAELEVILPDGIPQGITTVSGVGCSRFAQYLYDNDLGVEKIWKDYTGLDFNAASRDLRRTLQRGFEGILFCNGLVGPSAEWTSLLPVLVARCGQGSVLIAVEQRVLALTYYANLVLRAEGDAEKVLITIRKNRHSETNGEQATLTYKERHIIERVSAWARLDEMRF